jgi:hypothetical protein
MKLIRIYFESSIVLFGSFFLEAKCSCINSQLIVHRWGLPGLPEHIKYAELVRHMQTAEMSLVPKRHTSLGTFARKS